MQACLDSMPGAMRVRRRTVEHVFGSLKDWMGRSHFKTRTLGNVGTEASLHILAYNSKRAIALLGVSGSLALEHQAPISLIGGNEVFAACYPDRWRDGWTHVGTLTGWSTSLSLQAHSGGRCAVVWDDRRGVEFTSFATMLTALVERIGPCFSCSGIRDQTYGELEAALGRTSRRPSGPRPRRL